MKRLLRVLIIGVLLICGGGCGGGKPIYYYSHTSEPGMFIDSVCRVCNIAIPIEWDSTKVRINNDGTITQYIYTGKKDKHTYIFSAMIDRDSMWIVKIKKIKR